MKKKCNGPCGQEKELDKFGKEKHGKYGVKSICKDCDRIKNKIRYELKKEEILIKCKEYRDKGRVKQ